MEKTFVLRISNSDFNKLKKKAEKDSRSINSYLNIIIKKDLEQKRK